MWSPDPIACPKRSDKGRCRSAAGAWRPRPRRCQPAKARIGASHRQAGIFTSGSPGMNDSPPCSSSYDRPSILRTMVGTRTVLVAEDDVMVKEVTVLILEAEGNNVLAASNGHEALAMLAQNPPVDLLLTDVIMPGMTGFDLAE